MWQTSVGVKMSIRRRGLVRSKEQEKEIGLISFMNGLCRESVRRSCVIERSTCSTRNQHHSNPVVDKLKAADEFWPY